MRIDKKSLNLLREMTFADFRTKHINAYLGYLWSLLNPLLLFGAMYLIFSVFLEWKSPEYTVYMLLGIILWTFFSDTTFKGMTAVYSKAGIITKVNFPREIIVFSVGLNSIITLTLNLCIFAVFFIISPVKFSLNVLLLPIFLVQLIFFSLGISFALSAFFLRFRDLNYIWQFLLKIGFWLTPVIIPLSKIPQKYYPILFINPLTNIIKGARDVVIYGNAPSFFNIALFLIVSIIVFFAGYFLFRKMEKTFADYVVF